MYYNKDANLKYLKDKTVAIMFELVQGEAPDALGKLLAPDRVFIGGSGGSIRAILSAVCEALLLSGAVRMFRINRRFAPQLFRIVVDCLPVL